jgi:periodic tryptophan protein 2
LSYTADGSCILAGGHSKVICIYHVKEALLIKKFEITQSRSFDAMDDVISRKKMSEFGWFKKMFLLLLILVVLAES